MGDRKKFFRRPSAAQILNNTNNIEVSEHFWEYISNLKNGESVTLVGKLFDEPTGDEFLKRGPEVQVPVIDAKNPNRLPYELREETFNALKTGKINHFNGFVFQPIFHPYSATDITQRKVRLNDVLEGARLYAYAPLSEFQIPFKPSTQILKAYDSADGVSSIGTVISVKIPSRTKGEGKYEIKFFHIPLEDKISKYIIAPQLKTNHNCPDKDNETRYPTKKDPEFVEEYRFDEHEIAAYFSIIDYYRNLNKHRPGEAPNLVPLQMNMTGIPTPLMCRAYDNMLHRVLIKKTSDSKPKTLSEAHLEALLWEGTIKEGYRNTFFFKEQGRKLKDYPWTQYLK